MAPCELHKRTVGCWRQRCRRTVSTQSLFSADSSVQQKYKIRVIGAGAAGLSSALLIKRQFSAADVSVVAEKFALDTTSAGSGGLWKPFTLQDTPADLIARWGGATLDHLLQLALADEAHTSGVQLTSAYQLWRQPMPDPSWADVVPSFRRLEPRELQMFNRSSATSTSASITASQQQGSGPYTDGWIFTTAICDNTYYMPWLLQQVQRAGISLHQQCITHLSELLDCDLLVNCSGLGAAKLFRDPDMQAVRGQVLRVRAPWVRNYYNNDGKFYIIPNVDTIVLGGTTQADDWDVNPRDADSEYIMKGCSEMLPSLAHAEVVKVWAGLRPARKSVRLEVDQRQDWGDLVAGDVSRMPVVIHNYGHGGAGITLHWGCAQDVAALAAQVLKC